MFKIDLSKARQIELEFVRKILKPWVVRIEMPSDDTQFKDWDIKVTYKDGTEKTFEIKSDEKSKETWNVVFEWWYWDKTSGIYTSKADYIVYHFDDCFWWQERWQLLKDLWDCEKYSTWWWDWEKSKIYVVKKEIVMMLFNKLE